MIVHEDHFKGRGGTDIFRCSWLPEGEPRGDVVLSHGAGEHCGRYEGVAAQLVEAGYAFHAVDHRGHGRSSGRRAYIDRIENAVEDLHTLVQDVSGGRKPFLLGHSMGGCIAIEYALAHQDSLAGLVLSNPVAHLAAANPIQRGAGRVLSAAAPWVPVYRVDSALVSNDPDVVRDYESDPLVHHGGLPARTVGELARSVASFPARVDAIEIPLLLLLAPTDQIVPVAGGRMVYESASSPDKTLKEYDGLAHEILFEREGTAICADMIAWLDGHPA